MSKNLAFDYFTEWLEKAKKAYHTHDGSIPEHPVAVKDHQKYFAEHPEMVSSSTTAESDSEFMPGPKFVGLIDSENIQQYLDSLPTGTIFKHPVGSDNYNSYRKKKNGEWVWEQGGSLFFSEMLALHYSKSGDFWLQIAKTVKIPSESKTKIQEIQKPLLPGEIKTKLLDFPLGTVLDVEGTLWTKIEKKPDTWISNKYGKMYTGGVSGYIESAKNPQSVLDSADTAPMTLDEIDEKLFNVPDGTVLDVVGEEWTKNPSGQWTNKNGEKISKYTLADKILDTGIAGEIFSSVKENTSDDSTTTYKKPYAESFLDLSSGEYEKIGEQKGSTEGGTYRHPIHGDFYIKFPGDERAKIEHLAAKLYALAGVPVARTYLTKDSQGITGIGSKIIPSDEYSLSLGDVDPELFMRNYPEMGNSFVVDAWLANWDVIGMDYDNILMGNDGVLHRIDPGGSLTFRAKGAAKDFGTEVQELDTLRDSKINPQSARFFKYVTDEQLKKGAKRLQLISDESIDNLVTSVGLSYDVADSLAKTLKKRRDYVVDRVTFGGESAEQLQTGPEGAYLHPRARKENIRGMRPVPKVETILKRHSNSAVKTLTESASEFDWTDKNSIERFVDNNNQIEHIIPKSLSALESWQSGGKGLIRLRGAIGALKENEVQQYGIESGFWLHEKKQGLYDFDKDYWEGVDSSPGLIPFVFRSRQALRERFPEGYVTIFRGVGGSLAQDIRDNKTELGPNQPLGIPHDAISSYSLSKEKAKSFGSVVLSKKIPIDNIWIYFPAFSDNYGDEDEVIPDSDVVSLYFPDEIEV